MTTLEKWIGSKPLVMHLITFGYINWTHILDDKGKKLDAKNHDLIMVGYFNEFNFYRLFNLNTYEVICWRDFVFNDKYSSVSLFKSSFGLLVVIHLNK